MRKIIISLGLVFLISTTVHAQMGGGFVGPTSASVTTVKEAKQMKDDSSVVLVGNIINHIQGEEYTFQDASDSIVVEIDEKDWKSLVVEPTDTVKIMGEVDKELMKETKIDVDSISKL